METLGSINSKLNVNDKQNGVFKIKLYQIERRMKIALDMLRVNDNYLLVHDVNERSITHKLAMYLNETFGKNYDVDCEYNRNLEDPSNSKRIRYVTMSIENKLERSKNEIEDLIEGLYVERSVYPDVIVHKRGTNSKNLLAIEVKKSTSRINTNYDIQKLKCYTDSNNTEGLHYKYGVLIVLYAKQERYIEPELIYFKNGHRLDR